MTVKVAITCPKCMRGTPGRAPKERGVRLAVGATDKRHGVKCRDCGYRWLSAHPAVATAAAKAQEIEKEAPGS